LILDNYTLTINLEKNDTGKKDVVFSKEFTWIENIACDLAYEIDKQGGNTYEKILKMLQGAIDVSNT
jgi:hypothetical protein